MRAASIVTLVLAPATLLVARSAEAQEETTDRETEACTDAFMRAQSLRDERRLLDARRALVACAEDRCPGLLRKKCLEWLPELAAEIPSIAVSARDAADHELGEARLLVDGALVTGGLDGRRSIELDPGPHLLRVEANGRPPVEHAVTVAAGEHGRHIIVRVGTPPPASTPYAGPLARAPVVPLPPAATPSTRRKVAYAAFGVGGAGLVVGVVTGAITLSQGSDLGERCPSASGCAQAEIDDATAIAHTSTIGFAVVGAGVVAGLVLLLTEGRAAPPAQATRSRPAASRWAVRF